MHTFSSPLCSTASHCNCNAGWFSHIRTVCLPVCTALPACPLLPLPCVVLRLSPLQAQGAEGSAVQVTCRLSAAFSGMLAQKTINTRLFYHCHLSEEYRLPYACMAMSVTHPVSQACVRHIPHRVTHRPLTDTAARHRQSRPSRPVAEKGRTSGTVCATSHGREHSWIYMWGRPGVGLRLPLKLWKAANVCRKGASIKAPSLAMA